MKIWNLLITKQKYEMYLLNYVAAIRKIPLVFRLNRIHSNNRKIIDSLQKKDRVAIVMNGPSIKDQDFTRLFKEDVIFVNRGFKHPLYREIKPIMHVFVDSKMRLGIWPITWLDEILEMNPDIIFAMPDTWRNLDQLQPYIKKGIKFLWLIDNHEFIGGIGVTGAAIRAAIKIGYKNINLLGFEKTGFANELLKQASHFYGTNEENDLKTWDDYTQDFYMNFLSYVGLKSESKKWLNKGINIKNLTLGGLVEVFPRKIFEDEYSILNNK